MNAWLQLLRELSLFRRGPADVPHAPALLSLLIAIMIATDVIGQRLLYLKPDPTEAPLGNMLFGLLLLYGVLALNGKQARFVQTATAWILVRLAVTVISLVVMMPAAPFPRVPEELRSNHLLLAGLTLPLLIWYVALRVHILRHALEIPPLRAFFVFISMTILQLILLALLLQGTA